MVFDRKAYMKEYREKNREVTNAYMKEYREKNKETEKEYQTEYREKNKEKIKEYREKNKQKKKVYNKTYKKTDVGIKKRRISGWKSNGIIFHDYNWLYNVYICRHNCDYCDKEFKNDLDRHLDHNHDIDDNENVRGIICRSCNIKDVLKSK